MNPEIQKELLTWLQGLRAMAESGTVFAKDQIPQLLWEKILLDRVYLTVLEIGLLVIFAIALHYLIRYWKWDREEGWVTMPMPVFASLPVAVLVVAICSNVYPLLMVWFAPRLYLVEWIKEP